MTLRTSRPCLRYFTIFSKLTKPLSRNVLLPSSANVMSLSVNGVNGMIGGSSFNKN